jgi:outer membrane biogenesis lipoprotein LolB
MTPCFQSSDARSGHKFRSVIALLLFGMGIALMLDGCAWLIRPVQNDAAALQRIDHWAQVNAELKQFKGLMQVRIQVPNRSINGRAAFAAAIPGRLRLEFLNPIGQPLFQLASDGRAITVISMPDNDIHHLKQTGNALERLIGVPLSIQDLMDVLIGRPPLPDYVAAQISADGQPCEVVLKSRWNTMLSDLRSDTCDRISMMQVYNRQGELQYTIRWVQWQSVQAYVLPRRVQISTPGGVHIDLSIERVWPDVSLSPSTFVLQDPENMRTNSSP